MWGVGREHRGTAVVTRFLKWLRVDSGETRKAGMTWARKKVSTSLHHLGEATKWVPGTTHFWI